MRPDKLKVFLYQAFVISKLSHDIPTQHGCIIVDDKWRILGGGYNGLPMGFSDNSGLRIERPEKYNWMLHSEINALSNCQLKPYGAKAIVTGICCHNCLLNLHQNGISEVYMYDRNSKMIDQNELRLINEIVNESTMKVYLIGRDDKLDKMVENLNFSLENLSYKLYNNVDDQHK